MTPLHPKPRSVSRGALLLLCFIVTLAVRGAPVSLFDGHSFAGWEGDTNGTWRIEEGALVGGSLTARVPRNEFLCTTRLYTNFVLQLEFRLRGTEGFVNAGVQIQSERSTNPPNEMIGYQADIGEGWYGALYDESRRNKVLVAPDPAAVKQAVRHGEWNHYRIQCERGRIRTWINEVAMIDYTEPDVTVPQHGKIGLQIHGGATAEVAYRKIQIMESP